MTGNKKIIAVTGGIGVGKTELCKITEELGYRHFSCDEINRELLREPEYLKGLKNLFPEEFDGDRPDKLKLKRLIAQSEPKRMILNNYSHDRIMRRLIERIESCESDSIVVEIPLLNETDYERMFDKIIVLSCDKSERIRRIVARDAIDADLALMLIEAQSDEFIFENGCETLTNDGDLAKLREQIRKILDKV